MWNTLDKPRIVVVGVGIVGLCVGWHLAWRGLKPIVIEARKAHAAYAGNAGAISHGSVAPLAMPGVLRQVPKMLTDRAGALHIPARYWLRAMPWLLRFVASARPAQVEAAATALASLLYGAPERHREILEEEGALDLLRAEGQMYLYRDDAQMAKDAGSLALRRRHGLRMEVLDRAGLAALEPEVSPAYTRAVFLPDHGSCVNPARLAEVVVRIRLGPQRAALPDGIAQRLEQRRGLFGAAQCGGVVVLAELRLAQPEQCHRLQPRLARAAGRSERGMGGCLGGSPSVLAQVYRCQPAQCLRLQRRAVGLLVHGLCIGQRLRRVAQCQVAFRTAVQQLGLLCCAEPGRGQRRIGLCHGLCMLAGPGAVGHGRQGLANAGLRDGATPGRSGCVCWGRLRHGWAVFAVRPGRQGSQRVYRRNGQNRPQ